MATVKTPHKKGPRKANKIGRNGRAAAHRAGRPCTRKGCHRLMASRTWDRDLRTYVPKD